MRNSRFLWLRLPLLGQSDLDFIFCLDFFVFVLRIVFIVTFVLNEALEMQPLHQMSNLHPT